MSLPIAEIRKDFPQLSAEVNGRPLVYLDSAATALKPRCVGEAVARHYQLESSNVHRGVHYFSELATKHFEDVREQVRAHINAKSSKEVIFTSGTTASINLVARSYGDGFLKAGDEVIISHMEHHSNIVPWQLLEQRIGIKLSVVPILDNGELDYPAYKSMLSAKTKLVSMVYVSNSLGTINPIKNVIKEAHAIGAKVLVDAAQALPHASIDVQDLDCDFMAFSGHKLYGPTGVGVLYGKQALLEQMPPFLGGGDMIKSVSFTKTSFADLPYKFEAGTPPIAEVIGLGEALRYFRQFPSEEIMRYEAQLLRYAEDEALKIPGLRLIGAAPHKASILSFILEDIHPHDIGSIVDSQGVAIRTGHHCCQPVMERFGVPATARASFAFYNNEDDIKALVAALRKTKEIFA